MVFTENIRLIAKQATIVVSAHTVMLVTLSYAHQKNDLLYMMTTFTPVLLILCLVPLAAVLFLSTKSARQGAIVLLGVLPAEMIYNIWIRFTANPPITVREVELFWKIVYEGSFGIILVLEATGFWLTLKVLREIHKQLNSASE